MMTSNYYQDVLESIDVECFLNWQDPEWASHYNPDKDIAFDLMVKFMDPELVMKAIKESGARNENSART